jgi:hypothetical protein
LLVCLGTRVVKSVLQCDQDPYFRFPKISSVKTRTAAMALPTVAFTVLLSLSVVSGTLASSNLTEAELPSFPSFFPHTPRVLSEPPGALSELLEAYSALRTLASAALDRERDFSSVLTLVHPPLVASAKNLLHYLTMRESDLRIVQVSVAPTIKWGRFARF